LSSFVVNFWHGTPIKKIYRDSLVDLNKLGFGFRWLIYFSMTFLNSFISRYYASNSLEAKLLSLAAPIPAERISVSGSPRFDFIRGSAFSSKDCFELLKGKRIILYAPTWRDSEIWSNKFLISNFEKEQLSSYLLNSNSVLLLRRHPLTKPSIFSDMGLDDVDGVCSSDLFSDDINFLYSKSDLLITDVSSAVFDFLIVGSPIVFFMPDVDDYMSGDRGIYDYYKNFILKDALLDWSSLIEFLKFSHENSLQSINPVLDSVLKEVSERINVCDFIYEDLTKVIRIPCL
jgi:CDP-glycerol glycerophosphotransferase